MISFKREEKPREEKEKKKLKKKSEALKAEEEITKSTSAVDDKKKRKEERNKKQKKDDTYVMKKNTGMKVLRGVFWLILIFIFFRGIYQIVKPEKASELTAIINDFKEEQKNIGDHPEEVMRFAQDFAKEYLTYSAGGETEFKNRIRPYVSDRVQNIAGIYSFKRSATATYVNAYRREACAPNEYNVFVNADILYEIKNPETGDISEEQEKTTLKVPVRITENGYCIGSLPVYVADSRCDDQINPQELSYGAELDKTALQPVVENFLTAYYAQDQSMIDYLLTADADKSKFIGLGRRYVFDKTESLRAYMLENEIICILKIKIQDTVNDEVISQEYNMHLVKEGDKYYVKDMDTKITE